MKTIFFKPKGTFYLLRKTKGWWSRPLQWPNHGRVLGQEPHNFCGPPQTAQDTADIGQQVLGGEPQAGEKSSPSNVRNRQTSFHSPEHASLQPFTWHSILSIFFPIQMESLVGRQLQLQLPDLVPIDLKSMGMPILFLNSAVIPITAHFLLLNIFKCCEIYIKGTKQKYTL